MIVFLVVLCIVLVLLPPRYDPAIRLKEWREHRRRNPLRYDKQAAWSLLITSLCALIALALAFAIAASIVALFIHGFPA